LGNPDFTGILGASNTNFLLYKEQKGIAPSAVRNLVRKISIPLSLTYTL